MNENKNFKRILWVAEAALILALVVLAQLLSKVIPPVMVPTPFGPVGVGQLVTGSLVNLVLIVGAGSAGFAATAVACVLSPVLALLTGQLPLPVMIPVVALGNLAIVVVTWAFFRISDGKTAKTAFASGLAGILLGAVSKVLVLWGSLALIVVPLFSLKAPIAAKLTAMFSWPQGITAIIGGILALLVLPSLRKNQKSQF